MRVYSETVFSFIDKCEKMIKDIVDRETPYKSRRSRFEVEGYLYPIKVVVFEGKNLGYFDANQFHIGINKRLVYTVKDSVLKDILRHELAHYFTYIFYGGKIQPHGFEFATVCGSFKWPEEISKASINLEEANEREGDIASERVLSKIKNLLKLAESSNPHESELATLKANQLLLKHNLAYANLAEDQNLYVKKILTHKRKSAKLSAVYEIIEHFMVKPVIVYGRNDVSLEVAGARTNLELAEYVAGFLDEELERLWRRFKLERELKGLKAKNSFFRGVARGYTQKMKGVQKEFGPKDSMALTVVKNDLAKQAQRVYGRFQAGTSSAGRDDKSYNLGQQAGRSLSIHKGVKSSGTTLYLE